jgi:RHS repeat-associated protein
MKHENVQGVWPKGIQILQANFFRGYHLQLFRIITSVVAICLSTFSTRPAMAVTHDDQETIIPEFYISFRGDGTGTPSLTVTYYAYNIWTGSWTPYTESVSATGNANGVTWQSANFYVGKGMPLDLWGELQVSGQHIGEYKVFFNTPDPKYQAYYEDYHLECERHMVDWVSSNGNNQPNNTAWVCFKRAGDGGAVAGKVSSAMPGWQDFKLSLGYGRTGKPLGYLYVLDDPLVHNLIELPDTSEEVFSTVYLDNGGIWHTQIYAPQMNIDMYYNPNYTEPNYSTGAEEINCYDNATKTGVPASDINGFAYTNYSSIAPSIAYTLVLTNNASEEMKKIKRVEGVTAMDSIGVDLGWAVGRFQIGIANYGASTVSQGFSWDWATAGLGASRKCKYNYESVYWAPYPYNPSWPWQDSIISFVCSNVPAWVNPDTVAPGYPQASGYNNAWDSQDYGYYQFPNGGAFTYQHAVLNYDYAETSDSFVSGYFNGNADYYLTPGTGSFLKLDYVTTPTGGWTYYNYYDDINERGMVSSVSKPFGNSPSSPSSQPSGSMVTTYIYTNDWDGSLTLPYEVVTKLKGSNGNGSGDEVISRSLFFYSTNYYPNPSDPTGVPVWVTERHDYSGPGASSYTTTITKKFMSDIAGMFADLPVSVQHPDGTKDVSYYVSGTYNASTFVFTPSPQNPVTVLANPTTAKSAATQIWKISSFPATAPGAVPLGIDNSYVVPNKSTAEVQTRDQFGRVVRIDTLVCSGTVGGTPIWQQLQAETHSYDGSGNLTGSYKLMDADSPANWAQEYAAEYTDINGSSTAYSSIVFNNAGNPTGRKQYEWDRDGTIRKYYYDDYGRVTNVMTLQAPSIGQNSPSPPATSTFFTYDADDRITSQVVGTSLTALDALVYSNQYNLAGLCTLDIKPGGYVTTYDYSHIANNMVTEIIFGLNNANYNRTVITQKNLDGSVQAVYGTSVIPKCYSYSIQNLNGSVTLSDGSTALAGTPTTVASVGTMATPPAATTRSTTTETDWLGHKTMEDDANPAAVGDLITAYAYNNQGQLVSTKVGSLASTLNIYDSFGQLFRSGIDVNNNGTLDLASMDRISEQSTSFVKDGSGTWWEVTSNIAYPNANDPTPLVVKQTWMKQSGFSIKSLPVYPNPLMLDSWVTTLDADGNSNVVAVFHDRSNAITYTEKDSNLTGGGSYLTGGSGWSGKAFDQSGQNIYSLNGDGTGESTFSYDADGRLSQSTKYVGGNSQTTTLTYRTGSTEVNWQQNPDNTWVQTLFDPEGNLASNVVFNSTSTTPPSSGGKATCNSYNLRGQLAATWGNVPYPTTNIYYSSSVSGYQPELEGELYQQQSFNGGSGWNNGWQSSPGTPNILAFSYYPQNGLLEQKQLINGNNTTITTSYTYNQQQALSSRTTQRGVVTAYSYNPNTGDLMGINYTGDPSGINDPAISYTYDRLGALSSVTDVSGTRNFSYASDQQLQEEDFPSSFGNAALTFNYDTYSRLSGYQLTAPQAGGGNAWLAAVGYAYYDFGPDDYSGRLSDVGTFNYDYSYTYVSNSTMISSVSGADYYYSERTQTLTGFLLRTNVYDPQSNMMLASSNIFCLYVWLGKSFDGPYFAPFTNDPLAVYTCQYDKLHRLQAYGQTGYFYSLYGAGLTIGLGYNDRDEIIGYTNYVAASPANISSSTPKLPRRELTYAYDNNGNRIQTQEDASQPDADAALSYTPNQFGQYSSRQRPNFVEISGVTPGQNTILTASRNSAAFSPWSVMSLAGSSYEYFSGKSTRSTTALGVEPVTINSTLTLPALIVSAYGGSPPGSSGGIFTSTQTKNIPAPPTTENFVYDADGNLRSDAFYTYTYDDEDRVKQIQTSPSALAAGVPGVQLDFTYDYLSRRIEKKVYNYVGGSWGLVTDHLYFYDGENLIAECDNASPYIIPDKSYYWGLDMSGTLQGAGGVGGYLELDTTTNAYPAINDPWGNVVGLFDFLAGNPVAQYEYSPFGEPLSAIGYMATNNPFQFSTKYCDNETGLYNYGYRYYSPSLGRFLNPDPKDELGRL